MSGRGTVCRFAAIAVVLAWTAVGGAGGVVAAERLDGFGIVLMHGKGGQPGGPLSSLASALEAAGARVIMPSMAWSGKKGVPDAYDTPYEQALDEITRTIARLKEKGARQVVVAGQSLGANAAMAYAARQGAGLAAVVAIAPGHTPERVARRDIVTAREQAGALVAAGKGDARGNYPDFNQGQFFDVSSLAAAYLSYFDPAGPAVIPVNAAAMPSLPFLWVIGRKDPLYPAGPGYAYDKVPPHGKSRYLEIDAGHFDAPAVGRAEIVAWLQSLN